MALEHDAQLAHGDRADDAVGLLAIVDTTSSGMPCTP